MALYWPDKKVALDIVDDPGAAPLALFGEDWTIIRVTSSELEDHRRFREVMARIATLVGASLPQHESQAPKLSA